MDFRPEDTAALKTRPQKRHNKRRARGVDKTSVSNGGDTSNFISVIGWIFDRAVRGLGKEDVCNKSRDGDGIGFRLGAMTRSGSNVWGSAGNKAGEGPGAGTETLRICGNLVGRRNDFRRGGGRERRSTGSLRFVHRPSG